MYMYVDEKQTQIPVHGVFSIKTVSLIRLIKKDF